VLPLVSGLHRGRPALAVGGLLLLVNALQCVMANRRLRPVVDHYLERSPMPPRSLRIPAGLLAVALASVLALQALGAASAATGRVAVSAVLLPFGMLYALVVPVGVFVRRSAAFGGVLTVATALARMDAMAAVSTGALAAFTVGFCLLTSRCGAWTLAVLWEAERSREIQTRLAVAEERLRFGRDLHDVMGRDLAVIALKERARRATGAARPTRGPGADDRGAADRAGVAARGPRGRARLPRGRPRRRTGRRAGRGPPRASAAR
jgi:two-component system sensor histidine kinase DesK